MATRITLVHNTEAGFEQYAKERLLTALQQKGFSVSYWDYKKDEYAAGLKDPGALVVVAGGDGTVVKVGRELLGKEVPIGLLPLGTANNIATSLGIAGEPEALIARWDLSHRRAFDLGQVEQKGAPAYFFESVCFGVLDKLIREHSKDTTGSRSEEEELVMARQHFQEILEHYPGQQASISCNGKTISGNYLLVQVMNTGYAGPGIAFAPAADPGDGLLEVVLIRVDERQAAAKFLARQPYGGAEPPYLVLRANEVVIEWAGGSYQVGDDEFEEAAPVRLSVQVKPGQLQFLAV